ncbi:hypothetical protein [Ochrobactrum sp. A-1]|uniref:hypothetical protein n=1 Tax=Ochrobactrum sp. A-1 TaxID=2920940 RepID=UPI001F0A9D11
MKRIFMLIPLFTLTACGGPVCGGGESMARVMAEKFVKKQLNDPSSAEFENPSIVDRGECKYQIVGHFRARNGFGGMVKSRYAIDIKYNNETSLWQKTGLLIK